MYFIMHPAVGGEWRGRAGGIVFFYLFVICTYKVQKTEITFKGNYGYYSLLQLTWILCVLNTLP